MCVIVHQPKGKTISKDDAKALWETNSHGGGFAFIDDDGVLQTEKFMKFEEYWPALERARSQFPRRDYLLHMRIATHGSIHLDNVHPFVVDEHTVMAHNGIIHGVVDKIHPNDDRSDTRFFIDQVLPTLPEGWLDNEYLNSMVEEWIGWSKLMFMTTDPNLKHNIYRLGKWEEHNGLMLSNLNGLQKQHYTGGTWVSSPKPANTKPTTNSFTKYEETSDDWYDWWMYREMEFEKDETGRTVYQGLDEFDLEYLLHGLKAERATMFIMHPMILIDKTFPQIECSRCLNEIDLETAECLCWDEVCGKCWNFLALCEGQGDCSTFPAVYDYKTLTDKGKDFVNAGGKKPLNKDQQTTIAKVLALPLPEGEGNTKRT